MYRLSTQNAKLGKIYIFLLNSNEHLHLFKTFFIENYNRAWYNILSNLNFKLRRTLQQFIPVIYGSIYLNTQNHFNKWKMISYCLFTVPMSFPELENVSGWHFILECLSITYRERLQSFLNDEAIHQVSEDEWFGGFCWSRAAGGWLLRRRPLWNGWKFGGRASAGGGHDWGSYRGG